MACGKRRPINYGPRPCNNPRADSPARYWAIFAYRLRRTSSAAQTDIHRVSEEVIRCPREVGDLGNELGLDQCAGKIGASQSGCYPVAGRSRERFCERGGQAPAQIRERLDGHSGAHTAGIGELPVAGVITQQQRSKVGPRALRIGPADDHELLAVERLRLPPKASVSRRIGARRSSWTRCPRSPACRHASG
jgi:hypothetical protein